ncbi:hypothetical protein BDQ17DRAFT_1109738 [Cyathus striatus]|nr:hypothetical protein BDQ17DRAFT_1109738 [Cyathus striatus]
MLHLFASCTCTTTQRRSLTSWTLPSEREKEVRARRGWEVPPLGPEWIVRVLISIICLDGVRRGVGGGNESVLEATLNLLAAICRDSPAVVSGLIGRGVFPSRVCWGMQRGGGWGYSLQGVCV